MNDKFKTQFLVILNNRENISMKPFVMKIFIALENKNSSLQLKDNDFWKLLELYAHERVIGNYVDLKKLFPDNEIHKITIDGRFIAFLKEWKANNMGDNDYE